MRAAPIALVWLAPLVCACSLSLEGDHFRGDSPSDERDGGGGGGSARGDARAPGQPDPEADGAPEAADTCGETCPGGDCDLSCPARPCDCELDCAATFKTCKPKCEHRSDCAIDCRQVAKCEASCKYSNCSIDCTGARECNHVKCDGGSGCLLDCTGAERCEFEDCDGPVTSCPGGILACNRDCP